MKKDWVHVNLLHILNDGFKASLLLLLPSIAREFAINLSRVGFLGSAINSLEILLAIPGSHLASKMGGMKVLTYTVFLTAIGFLLTALSPNYLFAIGAFLIAGLGYGAFHPVGFAVVSHMFDKGQRGKQLGNFAAYAEVGKVGLASIIPIVVVTLGWRGTALLISGILFCFGFYFVYQLKKDLPLTDEKKEATQKLTYGEILNNKKFVLASLSFCLDILASGSLFIFIPFLLLQRNVPYLYIGALTSTYFIGNMFGKMFLGRLVDRFGNTKVFVLSELCMAIFIIILSSTTWLPLVIISSIILGIFTKGTFPVLLTMISDSVDHTRGVERAFGLNAILVGVASTIAPFILGSLSDRFGIVTAFYFSAGFALVATIPALINSKLPDTL